MEPAISPQDPEIPAGPLFDRLYRELHSLAHRQLAAHGPAGATLNTTVLVHEAYLRLAGSPGIAGDRAHFFNLAARVMRHVIIDFARRRIADKRGGGAIKVSLDEASDLAEPEGSLTAELLALDAALGALEQGNPDLARLVELRFFAGLPLEEIAPLLGRSERSLKRDWRRARAFLLVRLDSSKRTEN